MATAPTEEAFVGAGGTYGYRTGRTGARQQFHAGWDFRSAMHMPVYAAASGVVETLVRNDGSVESVLEPAPSGRAFNGYGNVVVIRQDDRTWASYNHLAVIKGLRAGQRVTEGQLIGTVGNTTNGKFPGMGAHLHFELRRAKPDGTSPFPGPYATYGIDPADWFARSGLTREGGRLAGLAVIPPARQEYEPPPELWWLGPLFKSDVAPWVKGAGAAVGALIGVTVVGWLLSD